jgi:uncharacterized membrane protein
MKLQHSVRIDAPSDRVWQVMTDIERWPEWTPSARSVVRHEDGPLRVGSSATLELRGAPKARWVVTSLQEGRAFWWASEPNLGPSVLGGHEITPDGSGSVVTLTIQPRGMLGALLSPIIVLLSRANVGAEAAGLKRRCDGSD